MTIWETIEAEDPDTGEMLTHIVPVQEHKGSKTKKEELRFMKRVEEAGCPVITDKDDFVTHTYFGHQLRANCVCSPRQGESDPGMYIHKQAQ